MLKFRSNIKVTLSRTCLLEYCYILKIENYCLKMAVRLTRFLSCDPFKTLCWVASAPHQNFFLFFLFPQFAYCGGLLSFCSAVHSTCGFPVCIWACPAGSWFAQYAIGCSVVLPACWQLASIYIGLPSLCSAAQVVLLWHAQLDF